MNLDLKDSLKFTFTIESTDIEDQFEFSQTGIVNLDEYSSTLEAIGSHMNVFLRLAGYIRRRDFMFMQDLDIDECEFLLEALKQYREYKGGIKCR